MDKEEQLKKSQKYTAAIYRRIEELAQKHGVIIGKWAMKADLTPSSVYYLKNTTSIPNLLTIKLLCEAINITEKEFFDAPYFDGISFLD